MANSSGDIDGDCRFRPAVPDRAARVEAAPDPASLGNVLSQLFQLRGYGRQRQASQLQQLWRSVAGPEIGAHTQALALRGGVLQVAVSNSVLLAELNGFHRGELLLKLHQQSPDAVIREIKFRLRGRK